MICSILEQTFMAYYYWLILALILFAMEIIVPGFVILWFGVGALAAMLLELLGVHNMIIQVVAFSVVSLVFVAASRTIFKKYFLKESPGNSIKTNMDVLIGKVAVVTEEIDNTVSKGRIIIEGQDWPARSADGNIISTSTKVSILRTDGNKLIVQ